MARSGLEGLIVPLIDLLMLGRRAVALRFALAKVELRLRASSVVTALVLAGLALVLVVIFLVLLVQAGLIGLAALGLTPLQATLAAAAACALVALIFLLIARSCLRRATLPLSSLAGTGENVPANRP
ncbi:MAG: phage holin family protein [Pseudotabrizicola sp.]|uniref:phage holin family protein n=1 Tax=Pseudotabrizicola sp. TaxID=2939647 RepID=UPI0027162225|nr:phage holin family protein [Pseudotabrizicola sp.]MDO8884424.1 phage holin family protein [Pseudotabrizicola sp.]MDP2081465.1 phage holin family protein [Pseudotabrizicola sp.]MDZ7572978.1 phage holin family protein [Pseudotabrizicola sp.]